MRNGVSHVAALKMFSKVKQSGTQGWQVTLPEAPGTVHAVHRYGQIWPMKQPVFLEDPYDYQTALCGAKVKVILPLPFSAAGEDECAKCEERVRVAEFNNSRRYVGYSGQRWGAGADL